MGMAASAADLVFCGADPISLQGLMPEPLGVHSRTVGP